MAGAQIRYDGHNRKKKTQTEEKRTANKGVLCYQRFENISDGYFNESQDKMDNAAEAGKVGLKVALDGRFDDRGSTRRHPHHRRHYRHYSYSD
jgi:hypothetical protein